MLLASIPSPPITGVELGPLDLRFYGVLIAVGAYVAVVLTTKRYAAYGGDPAVVERAAVLTIVIGVLGARIGYVIPRLDRFLERPQDILAIWQGGLTFFGGLSFGAVAMLWYARRSGMDVPAMLDAVAPAVPLAQAIGRWGNYFNQELYGRPSGLPWALEIDPRYRRPGFEEAATFHPTFLYESLWNLGLVAVIVWLGRRGRLRRGSLVFVYAIGAGIGRGWTEALRIDTAERYLGLSRNNWIAILVLIIGVVGLVWWQRGTGDEPATVQGAPDAPEAGEADGAAGTTDDEDTSRADTGAADGEEPEAR